MRIPELVAALLNLLREPLPALLAHTPAASEQEAMTFSVSMRPRIKLIWNEVSSMLAPSVIQDLYDYLQRGQREIALQILGNSLREAIHASDEQAATLWRLLNASDYEIATLVSKGAEPSPPPAYFLSLELQSLRCFGPPQRLVLSDGQGRPARWTIILAENGLGKTTLLQCLAAMSPTQDISSMRVGLGGTVPRFAGDPVLLDWARSDLKSKKGDRPMMLTVRIATGNGLNDRNTSLELSTWSVQGSDGLHSFPELRSSSVGGLVCYGFGAARRMGNAALAGSGSVRSTIHTLFHERGQLLNAEEWLLKADYAASRKDADDAQRQHLETVRKLLLRVLPHVTDLRVSTGEGAPAPHVEFETPFGWVGLASMSLGYRTLVAWMVDLASSLFERYPDSPNPLAEPAVVLVDEIDLHLHPSWQRELLGFVGSVFLNAQFVVTSHSPLIVQAAEQANIVLLRREGDHVVIHNDVDVIRGWRVDQILLSDLFGLESSRPPSLDPLLERRHTLLTKGRLTTRERKELRTIELQIIELPTGQTVEELEALDIIARAARQLRSKVE